MILLSLALLAAPLPAPASDRPVTGAIGHLAREMRRAGFTAVHLPGQRTSWISVELLPLKADLDGDRTDEIFTSDRRYDDYKRPFLTARKNGLPLWSRQFDEYAWMQPFEDVDGDLGRDLLVFERASQRVSAFASAEITEFRLVMLNGRSGRELWSYSRPSASVSPGVGGSLGGGLDFWPQVSPDATGDGLDDVLVVSGLLGGDSAVTAHILNGRTGARQRPGVRAQSSYGWVMVMPLPDVDGDGLADIFLNQGTGDGRLLRVTRSDGRGIWTREMSHDYWIRFPSPNFSPGDAPGELIFPPACTMLGCENDRTDALDAATGKPLWTLRGRHELIGDVDNDGHADLRGTRNESNATVTVAVSSGKTGEPIYAGTLTAPDSNGASPSIEERQTADLNRDGVVELVQVWRYPSHDGSRFFIKAVDGRTGSDLWARPFSGRLPSPIGSDVNGNEWDDFISALPQASGLTWRLLDGLGLATAWDVGPVSGHSMREPIAVNADGNRGDEVVLSWFVTNDEEEADAPDYLAAFGPAGRIWAVRITLDGTSTIA